MADRVYGLTEVVGTSKEGVQAAINNAVARAGATLRNLDWYEVVSIRGAIMEGAINHYQVTIKIGFRLEDTN